MDDVLAAVPAERRVLVTDHEVFGYFADRFDFEVVGTVIPSTTTDAAPSAADLDALAATIRDAGVPAIFTESGQLRRSGRRPRRRGRRRRDRRPVRREPRRAWIRGGDVRRHDAHQRRAHRGSTELIDFITDAFASGITQRALVGGLLAATTTALIGTWVVVRGLAFFGDALAHGVLPGIALAAVWGFDLTLGAALSAVVMVGGVNLVHRTTRLSDDTSIGLLFVGMLALGVIIISRTDSYAGDLTSFLFGDILGVQTSDLRLAAIVLAVTIAGVVLGHRAFLALAVDAEKATSLGLRPGLAHAAMLTLLALSVVASFRAVGTLLVFGLLVAPPATAVLIVRRLPLAMLVAVGLGWLAVVAGLVVSYHADTAASATIAGIAVAQFFVVLTVTEVGTRRRAGDHRFLTVPTRLEASRWRRWNVPQSKSSTHRAGESHMLERAAREGGNGHWARGP